MDKGYLPYLHNGKKFHTLPDGQCLYRYPKGDGFEIVKIPSALVSALDGNIPTVPA